VARILEGDRDRFTDLMKRYEKRIVNYVYRITHRYEEAHDLAQEIFVKVFLALDRYDPKYQFSTWLFRIARNAVLDHHRRTGVRDRAEQELGRALGEGEDPSRQAEDRVLFRELLVAIRRLPDRQREVIGLRHRSDLGFKEIGELMDCSEDAAKMLYHRALKALRAELDPDG